MVRLRVWRHTSKNVMQRESFWKHTSESCQVHDWKVRRCKRERESLELCENFWMHAIENSQGAKVSGEGTGFRVEEVYEQELELCESFWRRTIENSQVHERLVIVRLKVFEVHDFELKCSYSMQNSQFCNAMIFNATPPKHQVCVHTTLRGGELLDFEPYFSSGVVESTLPPGFSLAIATNINRSTPDSLTFKLYYRAII